MGNIFNEDFLVARNKAVNADFEGINLKIINLNHLKENKKQSGRNKDLNDLENLP
jgi:hypothetical protein